MDGIGLLIDLHLLVRSVHVLAGTVVVGGAALVWAVGLGAKRGEAVLLAARRYEWAFWPAAGVIVATGVGNLGAFGEGLAGPQTGWGRTLTLKLALVLLLLAGSGVRTIAVVRLGEGVALARGGLVAGLYAATALLSATIVVVAEVLAHG